MSLKKFFQPLETIAGFQVCPGIHTLIGATPLGYAVNFTIHSQHAVCCDLCLFHRAEQEPFAVIQIPDDYRIGDTWSIMVFDLDIYEIEYGYRLDGPYNPEKGHLFNRSRNLLDPYAKAVTGQSIWGQKTPTDYHGRIVVDQFEWGKYHQPDVQFSDLVIYEMHVRGFTKHHSSGVEHPGTFAGIMEKIPYLKELGINAVELMPIFEFDEMAEARNYGGQELLNYWGYNTTCFFAPNTSYSSQIEHHHEGNELKELIRTLKANGIQIFLDVVFNHTSEGNEDGPLFSFKGPYN